MDFRGGSPGIFAQIRGCARGLTFFVATLHGSLLVPEQLVERSVPQAFVKVVLVYLPVNVRLTTFLSKSRNLMKLPFSTTGLMNISI